MDICKPYANVNGLIGCYISNKPSSQASRRQLTHQGVWKMMHGEVVSKRCTCSEGDRLNHSTRRIWDACGRRLPAACFWHCPWLMSRSGETEAACQGGAVHACVQALCKSVRCTGQYGPQIRVTVRLLQRLNRIMKAASCDPQCILKR